MDVGCVAYFWERGTAHNHTWRQLYSYWGRRAPRGFLRALIYPGRATTGADFRRSSPPRVRPPQRHLESPKFGWREISCDLRKSRRLIPRFFFRQMCYFYPTKRERYKSPIARFTGRVENSAANTRLCVRSQLYSARARPDRPLFPLNFPYFLRTSEFVRRSWNFRIFRLLYSLFLFNI